MNVDAVLLGQGWDWGGLRGGHMRGIITKAVTMTTQKTRQEQMKAATKREGEGNQGRGRVRCLGACEYSSSFAY